MHFMHERKDKSGEQDGKNGQDIQHNHDVAAVGSVCQNATERGKKNGRQHRNSKNRRKCRCRTGLFKDIHGERSEEHTSELQSRFDLVCRLLLEKKKKDEKTKERTIINDDTMNNHVL